MLFRVAAEGGRESSTILALSGLLDYPLDFFIMLFQTLKIKVIEYVENIFGYPFSWWNIYPSKYLVYASMGACFMFVVADDAMVLDLKTRLSILTASFVSIFVIFLMLYVWWTPAGSSVIEGIQGRYFIPVLLAMLIALKPPKKYGTKFLPALYAITCILNIGFLMEILKATLR